jgi:ornithine carbamoyltransferase
MKHFIDLKDITATEMMDLLDLADQLKADLKAGRRYDLLSGKTLGMIFSKSSTRTRISFEVGMAQLGGQALPEHPGHPARTRRIGRGHGARAVPLSGRDHDRTYAHQDVLDLAAYGSIPIINGLTDLMHPCQAWPT